ncbi:YibE/F family protein [Gracilibacillus alcaliphilus]|uniref:YibE/F family protein n=1 Tax=Gracilibacillus alcaliphilus TaxID=1401441 RepID=UPI001956AA28|nr:YibE/F family protein [Gracilibacillus alcaliphilus]MBM7679779.1 putative membrane protein [Gracilibacillus alcaliphilus]
MNTLTLLAIILFVLMAWIGGKKGIKSFIALFINFLILILTVIIMNDPNAPPVLLTIIACGLISAVSLFFINDVNNKTVLAFFSTIVTIVGLIFFIIIMTEQSMIHGFGEEESDELTIYSVHIGLNFVQIASSVIIMSTIGAIVDTAISITSPMREIREQNPDISRKDLFLAGIHIGRDILGTSTNTLFFAFFGGYMGLIIWFKDLDYSLGDIVNAKVFSDEMITILTSGMGVALVIPVAAAMSAYYLTREKTKEIDEHPKK